MKGLDSQIQEEGSALASVLIIIVIISLFIGVMLSGIYVQNQFIQQDINEVKARYAAEAGIATFLNNASYTSLENETALKIIVQDSIEALIKVRPFGGFIDVESTAIVKGATKTVRVLSGAKKTDVFEHVVVLGDTSSVLMLTGSTQLKGDVLTGQIGSLIHFSDFRSNLFGRLLKPENLWL